MKCRSPWEDLANPQRRADNRDMSTSPRPARSIRLIRPLGVDGVGVFRVSVGESTAFYTLHEIPCFIGGRGFAVHRLGLGNLYHVRIGDKTDCSCECLGFLAHGYCRHIQGLRALIRRGLL
jgi:hypothetical protein